MDLIAFNKSFPTVMLGREQRVYVGRGGSVHVKLGVGRGGRSMGKGEKGGCVGEGRWMGGCGCKESKLTKLILRIVCSVTLTAQSTHHIDASMVTMVYLIVPNDRVTPCANLHPCKCITMDIVVL